MTDTDLRALLPLGPPRREDAIDPRPRRLALLAVGAGIALDIGIRGGPSNLAVSVGLVLAAVALSTDGRIVQREARLLVAAATVPALLLAVRSSGWLAASNLVAACTLVGLGLLLARSGSVLDVTPRRLLRRTWPAIGRGLSINQVLRPVVPAVPATGAAIRVLRAALTALPLLVVLVALLASGDAVFADLVVPDVGLGPLSGHLGLVVLFAVGVLSLAAVGRGDADDHVPTGSFGALEVTTMLGLVAAVVGLFAVSQLVALTGAGQRLVTSAGLTPSEYARSGFFQLCWATAVVVTLLGLVRALAGPGVMERRAVRLLATAVPLLALGLVTVSLRRMALYDQAFGLTLLRLWVVLAAVWMGSVLVMMAARDLGLLARRDWMVAGAAASAGAILLVTNAANPEALVLRHNVDRAAAGAALDVEYLRVLGDDALPALADQIASVEDGALAQQLLAAVPCGSTDGVAALNLAAVLADGARLSLCSGSVAGTP